MKKLTMQIATTLLAASSVKAGDFTQAADAGLGPSNVACGLTVLAILVLGTVLFLCRHSKLPAIIGIMFIATVMPLRADFAGAADSGYYIPTGWFVSFWSMWWGNATASFGKFTPVPKTDSKSAGGQMPGRLP